MEQFDTLKMINDLTKGFEKLVKDANDSLNNLPEEQRQKVAKHQSELNNVLKELKKGNIEGLKKIIKNANSDSK
jgi:hypothetical protein